MMRQAKATLKLLLPCGISLFKAKDLATIHLLIWEVIAWLFDCFLFSQFLIAGLVLVPFRGTVGGFAGSFSREKNFPQRDALCRVF